MSVMCYADQIVRVKDISTTSDYIINRNRIKMMNHDMTMNIIAFTCQVTTIVTDDDLISKFLPFRRIV